MYGMQGQDQRSRYIEMVSSQPLFAAKNASWITDTDGNKNIVDVHVVYLFVAIPKA